MEPIQQFLQDSDTRFVLNFNQISSFLRNSFGFSDPISIGQEYANDISGLLNMLSIICPYCAQRSLKNRFTRIQKKIGTPLNIPQPLQTSTSESDNNLSDYDPTY
ncbi:hypothetical protein WA026_019511 [Henosepilachna vigintioctopunctata]|uniref:Uncharacterized protein n=1 Tax=Henosepilachna vigintioctopunctata TaxID=420089 RepID=A0AAW1TVT9_9CUCU